MKMEDTILDQNATTCDLLTLADKVVLFECDDTFAFRGFEHSDTWIGKIPCSAAGHSRNEVTENGQ